MWTTILLSSFILDPDTLPSPDGGGHVEVECNANLSAQSDLIARLCQDAAPSQAGSMAAAGSGNLVILVPVAAATAAGIGLAGLKDDAPTSR